jgi:hypothetical protein
LQNLAVHLVGVLIVEWWQASQHLVQQDTKSPPINRLAISITKKQFGSKIFRCSAECCDLIRKRKSVSYRCKSAILLLVRSSSFMSSLQRPKSHSAIWPV